ncbi:MAG: hypothetical protein K9K32_00115 [Halanaerobiales bacterium]|nr:hypothetical protein [Halanaerobiales bacterium]
MDTLIKSKFDYKDKELVFKAYERFGSKLKLIKVYEKDTKFYVTYKDISKRLDSKVDIFNYAGFLKSYLETTFNKYRKPVVEINKINAEIPTVIN